ncbi:amidohydrolase family protein [Nonomuraea zeae]|uniref:Amidohydrolase n=1 Tax=Nonomuraea zeae TaxID=1642303 RepID=A0A5S4GID7_9ACTN|nr:amidohydrolase family protein [Nonomuraea zeae]TMR26000.1 amidohydrolase [Nonomuraea zeae]
MCAADPPLSRYRPVSQLRVAVHEIDRARVPAVDAHIHLGRWLTEDGDWMVKDVPALIGLMDELNLRGMVNLDGRWGRELAENIERYDAAHPGRFATFCHVDWSQTAEPGFGERLAGQLRRNVAEGAAGLKVWKDVGLRVRDDRGELVMLDDPRLDPLWAAVGEAGIPIALHTADPVAFFEPIDERNERLELLGARPDWSFSGPEFPPFERLMEAMESMIARHPATTVIGVHAGCWPENLGFASRMLDTYPNFHVDIAARIAELGRQPRATRALMLRHPGRVLFGTDEIPPDRDVYRIHFRFMETDDEAFAHSLDDPPLMGRWTISGLDLPDEVLQRVYAGNALDLVPRLA